MDWFWIQSTLSPFHSAQLPWPVFILFILFVSSLWLVLSRLYLQLSPQLSRHFLSYHQPQNLASRVCIRDWNLSHQLLIHRLHFSNVLSTPPSPSSQPKISKAARSHPHVYSGSHAPINKSIILQVPERTQLPPSGLSHSISTLASQLPHCCAHFSQTVSLPHCHPQVWTASTLPCTMEKLPLDSLNWSLKSSINSHPILIKTWESPSS